ncbi:hypothetical protein K3495_g303 [Podosphaera aphanis]|nr:hypothetical protein K3495_g303 [Podosphaera aphanis]
MFQSRCQDAVIPNTKIKVISDIHSLRSWRRKQLFNYRSVGLVPTMGALHQGHLSLIRMAAKENSAVVISIYVNPSQFAAHEDLGSYPKNLASDLKLIENLDIELAADGSNFGKIAAVFTPTTAEMYPSEASSQDLSKSGSFVTISPISEILEGVSRPQFFRGVATVCTKLFNIVTPEKVYFGQKDIQQTVVIKKMVKDFCMDTQVQVGETMRETDGLALSSRNVYLGTRRRKIATVLYNALRLAEKRYLSGDRSRNNILQPALGFLSLTQDEQQQNGSQGVRFDLDYFSLADPDTLEEIQEVDESKGAILSGAIKLQPVESPHPEEDLGFSGGPAVRLLDNIILRPVH